MINKEMMLKEENYKDVHYRWLTKDSKTGEVVEGSNIYEVVLLDLSVPSLTGHVYNREALDETIKNVDSIPLKSYMEDIHSLPIGVVTNVKIPDKGLVVGELKFLTVEGFMHQDLLESGVNFFPALNSLVSHNIDLGEVFIENINNITLLPLKRKSYE